MVETRLSSTSNTMTDPFEDAIKSIKSGPKVNTDTMVTLFRALNESVKTHFESMLTAKDEEIQLLQKRTTELEDRCDALEQYGRRNAVRVRGVPEPEKGVSEDTDSIVCDLANEKLGLQLDPSDLVRSHRVGKLRESSDGSPGMRDIIVKFVSHNSKVAMMKNRSKLKGSRLFINEDLSRIRASLAYKARVLKREKKILDTWTRDGAIYLKLQDSSTRRVITETEFSQLSF